VSISRESIERAVHGYVDACNKADANKIRSYFVENAVHYFPKGSPFGTVRGAAAIAECWTRCVKELGSWWTVDRVIIDAEAQEAVVEWTHFKPKIKGYLRGDEWYRFDNNGLITEIRAYYACPAQENIPRHEIGDYPYEENGYPMALPKGGLRARSSHGKSD
jgi:hypothetical protein